MSGLMICLSSSILETPVIFSKCFYFYNDSSLFNTEEVTESLNIWLLRKLEIITILPCQYFSLRNPKNFRTCKPFKFSNARFFYPYQIAKKCSNATFFRQIALQNLQHKNLGFSETDLEARDAHIMFMAFMPPSSSSTCSQSIEGFHFMPFLSLHVSSANGSFELSIILKLTHLYLIWSLSVRYYTTLFLNGYKVKRHPR